MEVHVPEHLSATKDQSANLMGGESEQESAEARRIALQFQDLARTAGDSPTLDQLIQGWSLLLDRSNAGPLKNDPHLIGIIAFLQGKSNFLDHNDASLGNFALKLATTNPFGDHDGWFINGLNDDDRIVVQKFAEAMKDAANLHTAEARDVAKSQIAQTT